MSNEGLIAKYFKNTLSKSEQLEFDNLLKSDSSFKAEVEEYQDIQKAFKINEAEDLKVLLKTVDGEGVLKKKTTTPFIKNKFVLLAIAACLIIGAFYVFENKQNPDELYAYYFETYPNVLQPIVRGNESENHDAFLAYENKHFNKAEITFKAILKEKSDPNLEFYYAMSLLNQNKIKATKIILNRLKSKNPDFLPEIYWYSALIALKENNTELAMKELKKLDEINSEFKIKERKDLLDTLN